MDILFSKMSTIYSHTVCKLAEGGGGHFEHKGKSYKLIFNLLANTWIIVRRNVVDHVATAQVLSTASIYYDS